ncbi:uncharacterized protein LOC110653299 [Hevea brasiliensis]|nr:uncharacterized protein LOC110653299 [Hevea brasiliensis]
MSNHDSQDDLIQLAAFLLWFIWKCRNALVFNGQNQPPHQVIQAAISSQLEFNRAKDSASPSQVRADTLRTIFWFPPTRGTLKVNFDTAVDSKNGRSSMGIVVQDHSGNCVDWYFKVYPYLSDPLILESMACRDSISLILNRGFQRTIVEGDSDILINAIPTQCPPSGIASLVNDIQQMSQSLDFLSFSVVKRSCNRAAHCLAQKPLHVPFCRRNAVLQYIIQNTSAIKKNVASPLYSSMTPPLL